MGQSDEDDMEIETFSDVGASKVSDDSGIEDMNDDGCPLNSNNDKRIDTDEQPAIATEKIDTSISVKDLNYEDADNGNQDAMLPCIYPLPFGQMPQTTFHQDVRDSNGIAGVCGLQNLGNTCFINAGLQCIMKTPLADQKRTLNQRSSEPLQDDIMRCLITFAEKFQDISRKISSGTYSTLCASDFHRALANAHSSFGDHKQHDCQEFILFVLNALHETHALTLVPGILTHQEARETQQCVNIQTQSQVTEEDCKRMKMDKIENDEPDAGVECEDGVSDAERSWRAYTRSNNSHIIDTFHGQFKSIVTCGKCDHVSVTYEPFVCISLPIPHAMEKQIVVTWLPSPKNDCSVGKIRARRFLVTVKEYSHMKDIKCSLLQLLQSNEDTEIRSDDFVLSEVKHSTIVRTLDDRMQIQYLDTKESELYAIEVCPVTDRFSELRAKNVTIDKLTKEDLNQLRETGSPTLLDQMDNKSYNQKPEKVVNDEQRTRKSRLSEAQDSLSEDENLSVCCGPHLGSTPSECCECNYEDYHKDKERGDDNNVKATSSGWHSCSICLEDTFDDELTIHTKCGGMLCNGCLETTNSYHNNRNFPCPVCRTMVSSSDYKSFVNSNGSKIPIRNITVPLLFRHLSSSNQSDKRKKQFATVGHPILLIVPSQVNSSMIYQSAEIVLQRQGSLPSFRLVVTDAQGQNCTRCDPVTRCNGCTLQRDIMVTLRPGDHFTVDLATTSEELLNQMNLTVDDASMQKQRQSNVVQLDECFESFCASESLAEENTWFCPQCKIDQVATKVMGISRFPHVAIVHLKRFYWEELQSRKVESPVEFPLTNLNLENYSSENDGKEEVRYDLVSCVCHTGDLSTGHYTSYARHEESGKWYYFNDEVFSEKSPSSSDYEKAYVLFYHRTSGQSDKDLDEEQVSS